MTNFDRDEFDRVPETSSRQGVHRAVSEPARRRLGPILAVGIAALAIGLVAFLILPKLGFLPGGTPPSVSAESPGSGASAGAPSSSAEPSASPEPSLAPTPTDTPTPPSGAVDKSQPVAVFNGAGTAGLASKVSGSVQADGWILGEVANWQGAPQQTSVIFYKTPSQKGNAEALGALLNISSLVESADIQVPMVVVLGPGFQ